MQKKMQELFLQQKEKGGIIDLEAEGKKYLVVTNSSNSQDEPFTELSPTDYQLGKLSLTGIRERAFLFRQSQHSLCQVLSREVSR